MQKQIKQVKEFQDAFGRTTRRRPINIPLEDFSLRSKLGSEELEEYFEACAEDDVVEIADALGDQLYILLGTILEHGMQDIIEDVFDEIHRSNMSKLDAKGKPVINGTNGVYDMNKPIGKVLKSKRFTPPNLKQFINN